MVLRRTTAVGAAALLMCALGASRDAEGADMATQVAPPASLAPPTFTWSGPYLGAFLGGGSGRTTFHDPYGPSIYGDNVRTPFAEGGGAFGYNFQSAGSRFVFGAEAEGGALDLGGSNTCLAYSGFVVPANCRADGTALATGTGRIGYAFGASGRTLAYVKAGVATLFGSRVVATGDGRMSGVFDDKPQVGLIVGAGLERALSNVWSLKIEYDYADFGSVAIGTPQTQLITKAFSATIAPGATSVRASVHEIKIGLNFHIGAVPGASLFSGDRLGAAFFGEPGPSLKTPAYGNRPGYQIEAGGRYWYSFGRFQRDLGGRPRPANFLISRLTYNEDGGSGEIFGRIDTPSRFFVKGFLGAGGATDGHQDDEDFRARFSHTPVAYSNTLSSQRGTLDYATIDVGYAFLKNEWTSAGGFAGYNYYKDDKTASGCQQIANINADCSPALPSSVIGLSQDDRYNSVRLGLNGDIWIDRVRVQADAAFLPFVGFNGTDTHFLRFDVSNQTSPQFGRGRGVQLELITSFYLTPNLSAGIGGRYWAMWVPKGQTNDFSAIILAQPTYTERYGVTAQIGYRFSSLISDAIVAKY